MAFRNFPGKSQGWLETELGKVLDDLASGRVVVSSGAGDSNLSERVEVTLVRRKEMILSDLNVLAPSTYPRTDVIGAKRTRPRYT
jgi:hypothetical protein